MESSVTISVGAMRCRCCLAPGAAAKDLSSEYDWMGEKEVYADMLLESFDVRLKRIENAGWTICDTCITRLRDSTNFKKQVLYSEKTLLQGLTCDSSKPDISSDSKSENVKTEALSDDDDADHFEVQYLEEDIDLDENIKDISVKMEPLASTSEMSNDEDVPLSSLTNNAKRKVSSRINVSQIKSVGSISKLKQKAQAQVQAAKLKAQLQAQAKLRTQQLQAKLQAMKSQVKIKPPPGASKFVMNKMGQIKIVPKSGSAPMIKTGSQMPVLKKPVKITVKPGTETSTLKKITAKPPAKKGPTKEAKTNKEKQTSEIVTLVESANVIPFKWSMTTGFRCFYCKQRFHISSDMLHHTTQSHNPKKFKDFVKFHKRDEPINIDISDMQCNICEESHRDLTFLKTHLVLAHEIDYFESCITIIPFILRSDKSTCTQCDSQFATFTELYKHTTNHFNKYICDICQESLLTRAALLAHASVHRGDTLCHMCERIFPNIPQLKTHIRSVHKRDRVLCHQCGERFSNYDEKVKHLAAVHDVKSSYSCPMCGKEFLFQSRVNVHIRNVHLNLRKFPCDTCDRAFQSLKSLQLHRDQVHTKLLFGIDLTQFNP